MIPYHAKSNFLKIISVQLLDIIWLSWESWWSLSYSSSTQWGSETPLGVISCEVVVTRGWEPPSWNLALDYRVDKEELWLHLQVSLALHLQVHLTGVPRQIKILGSGAEMPENHYSTCSGWQWCCRNWAAQSQRLLGMEWMASIKVNEGSPLGRPKCWTFGNHIPTFKNHIPTSTLWKDTFFSRTIKHIFKIINAFIWQIRTSSGSVILSIL